MPNSDTIGASSSERRRIGRYEVLGTLGRGGMGVVYHVRAVDGDLGEYALKLLLKELGDLRKRFRQEATILQFLGRHPHIVGLHEVGEDHGRPFIVMDLLGGGTLEDRLDSDAVSQEAALEVLAKVSRALHFAHEAGIIHRDLKPSNILISQDGEPALSDFGIAKSEAGEALTGTGTVLGTLGCMAPEQLSEEAAQLDRRADVYALGVILYRILTGSLPFSGESLSLVKKILMDDPDPPSSQSDDVDPWLEKVCLQALQKQPALRQASAELFALQLERVLDVAPEPARPTSRRSALGSAFSLAMVVLVLVLAVALWRAEVARRRLTAGLWSQAQELVRVGRPIDPALLAELRGVSPRDGSNAAGDGAVPRLVLVEAESLIFEGRASQGRSVLESLPAGPLRCLVEAEACAALGRFEEAADLLQRGAGAELPWWPQSAAERWQRLLDLVQVSQTPSRVAELQVIAATRLASGSQSERDQAASWLLQALEAGAKVVATGDVEVALASSGLRRLQALRTLARSQAGASVAEALLRRAVVVRSAGPEGRWEAVALVDLALDLWPDLILESRREAASILEESARGSLLDITYTDWERLADIEDARARLWQARLLDPSLDLSEACGHLARLSLSDDVRVAKAACPWLWSRRAHNELMSRLRQPLDGRVLADLNSVDRKTWPEGWAVYIDEAEKRGIALDAFQEWLLWQPRYSLLWIRLGKTLGLHGRTTEALAAMRQGARLEDTAEAHFWLAELSVEVERPEEAVRHARRAVEIGEATNRFNLWHDFVLARALAKLELVEAAREADAILGRLFSTGLEHHEAFWLARAQVAKQLGDKVNEEIFRQQATRSRYQR